MAVTQADLPVAATLDVTAAHIRGARRFGCHLARSGRRFIARSTHPQLALVLGSGDSPAAAVEDFYEAVATALAGLEACGMALPQPEPAQSRPLQARLPRGLQRALEQRADTDGRSVNETLVHLLTEALARPQAPAKD